MAPRTPHSQREANTLPTLRPNVPWVVVYLLFTVGPIWVVIGLYWLGLSGRGPAAPVVTHGQLGNLLLLTLGGVIISACAAWLLYCNIRVKVTDQYLEKRGFASVSRVRWIDVQKVVVQPSCLCIEAPSGRIALNLYFLTRSSVEDVLRVCLPSRFPLT